MIHDNDLKNLHGTKDWQELVRRLEKQTGSELSR